MATSDVEQILAGCDEQQRAAITCDAKPLLVVAGAGAGKTRVLTRRIAWRIATGDAAAAHVLALTFTRKAAAELRDRLRSVGLPAPVTAGTFHSLALAQLRARAADDGRTPPAILDSKARLLARVVSAPRSESGPRRGSRRELIATTASEIEWAKSRRITPEAYAFEAASTRRPLPAATELIADWYSGYEVAKQRAGLLDFEDLLEHLADAIISEPAFAAVQRWRFRHLFVDELQDANAAQLRLLDAWLGARDDLFAVGDARQAIYGWNGADPSGVTHFAKHYPGATVIELATNYRSSPQVVTVATAVFGSAAEPPPAPSPDGNPPTVTAYESESDEALGVAASLRSHRPPGMAWSSCAILARTNAQLAAFEEVLGEAGIPFRSSTRQFLRDRPDVKSALALLDPRGGSDSFHGWLTDLRDERPPLDDDPATTSEDTLALLTRLAGDYDAQDAVPSASGFLAFLDEATKEGAFGAVEDGVELLTFHRAKGLEWPVVFATGLEAGYLPISHAKTRAAVDEERRLLYVALTRATSELHLSWAKTRAIGSRMQIREPSPFLADVTLACRALERQHRFDPVNARTSLASVRALLESVPASD